MKPNFERVEKLLKAGLTWEEIARTIERKPWSVSYLKNQYYKLKKTNGAS